MIYGERSVQLDGEFLLDVSLLSEICSLTRDSCGKYTVEFLDPGAVARALQQAHQPLLPPPPSEAPPPPPADASGAQPSEASGAQPSVSSPGSPGAPGCLLGAPPAAFAAVNTLVRLQVWNGACWINEVHIVPPHLQSSPHAVSTPPTAQQPADKEVSGASQAVLGAALRGLSSLPSPPNPAATMPKYRHNLRGCLQLDWTDIANGRDTRTTLRFCCLPAALCEGGVLRRTFVAAELSQLVDCIRIFPGSTDKSRGTALVNAMTDCTDRVPTGRRAGAALVNAVDSSAAMAIAKYFHGRQWGSGLPVAVSFATVQGLAEVAKEYPLSPEP